MAPLPHWAYLVALNYLMSAIVLGLYIAHPMPWAAQRWALINAVALSFQLGIMLHERLADFAHSLAYILLHGTLLVAFIHLGNKERRTT